MNLLRTLDVNGGNVNFYFKGNLGPRTILGGILNISLGFVFILLIVGFGRDFYLRINPQSVVQELFLNEYPKYTLTNQNYPLAFRIEDSNALLLDTEHKYFYFSIYQYYYERVDGVMQMVNTTNLTYHLCTESDFPNKAVFESYGFNHTYCLDANQSIIFGGYWDGSFISPIYMDILICPEGQINNIYNQNIQCGAKNVSDAMIAYGAYASIFVPIYLMDPSNYTTPLNLQFQNFYLPLDKYLFKEYDFVLQTLQVQSDFGWLIEDLNMIEVINLKSNNLKYSYLYETDGSYYEYYLANFTFYGNKQIKRYLRSYEKIQTLAAQVGGLLKIFTTIISFVVQFFNKAFLDFSLIKVMKKFNRESIIEGTNKISVLASNPNFNSSINKLNLKENNQIVKGNNININNESISNKEVQNSQTLQLSKLESKLVYLSRIDDYISKNSLVGISGNQISHKEEDASFNKYFISKLKPFCRKDKVLSTETKALYDILDIENVLSKLLEVDWFNSIFFGKDKELFFYNNKNMKRNK